MTTVRPDGPTLLHLSDLHFGCEDPLAVGALRSLADRLAPDVVAVTGDLTQRATVAQFDAARRFLASLRCHRLCVQQGNHDIPLWAWWERLLRPHRRFEAHFGRDRRPVVDRPWLRLVAADSVARLRHAGGRLSIREVDRVAAAVSDARPGQLRVVTLHHPLDGPPQDLHGAAAACRRWAAAGAQLVLAGHGHRPSVRVVGADPAGDPGLWMITGGTAVSRRLRGGVARSVHLIGASSGGAWIQRWDFDAREGQFHPAVAADLPWPPRATGLLSDAADSATRRPPAVANWAPR